jgi:uncharacterized protein YjeT (DUF2065 family)
VYDPVSEDVARGRWMTINALRIAGVTMVIVGLLTVRGVIEIPAFAGYALIAVGLLDVFLVPRTLARKWRSPLE